MKKFIEFLILTGLLLIAISFAHFMAFFIWPGAMLLVSGMLLNFLARRPEFQSPFEETLWN